MKVLLLFAAAILIACCGLPASAAVYTPSTIAEANALIPQPGDSILFTRGQTYTGTLIVPDHTDGSASAPITYGMTGDSGDRPIIDANHSQFGVLNVDHSYIVFDHLVVQNATKACFADVQTQNNEAGGLFGEHITYTNDAAYHCGDTEEPAPPAYPNGGGGLYFGEAGFFVTGAALPNQHALAGIVIANNDCGIMDVTPIQDDAKACILVRNADDPQINYNYVHSESAMGIAVRSSFGANTSGKKGHIEHNNLTLNEGNIVSFSNDSFIAYNIATESKGFCAQAYPGSTITGNTFTHLGKSTSGGLYNGIDENGMPNVTITYNSIYDVWGCMITLETTDDTKVGSGGAIIDGNNLDARTGGPDTGCIFLIESAATNVMLKNNTYHVYDEHFAKPFIWDAPSGSAASTGAYNLNTRDFLNIKSSQASGSEIMFSGCEQQISNGQFVTPLCP